MEKNTILAMFIIGLFTISLFAVNSLYMEDLKGIEEPELLGASNREYPDKILAVDGDEWLTGWQYRQKHGVMADEGQLYNYTMRFNVEYGSGTSSGDTIYCGSECQTDFDDIRFTMYDGDTELDYWLEEKTDSDDATFWVKVPYMNDNGPASIYVYYGNDAVSTTSDGEDTFLFFDNFNDASLNASLWDDIAGSNTESGGYLKQEDDAAHTQLGSVPSWTAGVAMHALKTIEDARIWGFMEITSSVPQWSGDCAYFLESINQVSNENEGTQTTTGSITQATSTWQNYAVYWYSSSHVEFYIDGVEEADHTTNIPNDAMRFYGYVNKDDTTPRRWFDWVFVRKLTSGAEPTHGTWGSEEEVEFEPNWLIGWEYRQKLTITGGSGCGTNYQISLVVHKGTGTSSGDVVYLEDNCQDNFGDVRFTDRYGNTTLDYWMDTGTLIEGTESLFWVEVADTLDFDVDIYIYYGTESATGTVSNGTATFMWFYDFEDDSIDGQPSSIYWEDPVDNDGSSVVADPDRVGGKCYKQYSDGDTINSYIDTKSLDLEAHEIAFQMKAQRATDEYTYQTLLGSGGNLMHVNWKYISPDYDDVQFYDGAAYQQPSPAWTEPVTTIWQTWEWQFTDNSDTADLDDITSSTSHECDLRETYDIDSNQLDILRLMYCNRYRTHTAYFDDLIVRKWTSGTEPSPATWAGQEGNGTGTVLNWLDGFSLRQRIWLTSSYDVPDDCVMTLEVKPGYGTSTSTTVYCGDFCQLDFDDIRFTADDGNTSLGHWREYKVNGNRAKFWIRLPYSITVGRSIFMYYRNETAVNTASNYSAAFPNPLLTEDFYQQNGPFISDDWIQIGEADMHTHSYALYPGGWDYGDERLISSLNFSSGIAVISRISERFYNGLTENIKCGLIGTDLSVVNASIYMVGKPGSDGDNPRFVSYKDSEHTVYDGGASNWQLTSFVIFWDEGTLKFTLNGVEWGYIDTNVPTGNMHLFYDGPDIVGSMLLVHDVTVVNFDKDVKILSIDSVEWDGKDVDLELFAFRKAHMLLADDFSALDINLKFELFLGGVVDSYDVVCLENMARNDFGDVRFTDEVGNILPYWFEDINTGENATVWTRLSGNFSENRAIYVYVGNSELESASSGLATFKIFDGGVFTAETSNDVEHFSEWSLLEDIYVSTPARMPGYKCRQKHTILNATGAGTDYVIRFTIKYGSGTTTGDTLYCSGLVQPDFDDVRFTASDGVTELSYWKESYISEDTATFWVQIPDNLSTEDYDMWIYWGYQDAVDSSDPYGIFEFFDDFSTPPTSKWDWYGEYTVNSGMCKLGYEYGDGYIQSGNLFSGEYMLEARTSGPYDGDHYMGFVEDMPVDFGQDDFVVSHTYEDYMHLRHSDITDTGYEYPAHEWVIESVYRGDGYAEFYTNRYFGGYIYSESITLDNAYIGFYGDPRPYQSGYEIDWVFLRKAIQNEPQHGAWGERPRDYTPYVDVQFVYDEAMLGGLCPGAGNVTFVAEQILDGLNTLMAKYFNYSNNPWGPLNFYNPLDIDDPDWFVYDADGPGWIEIPPVSTMQELLDRSKQYFGDWGGQISWVDVTPDNLLRQGSWWGTGDSWFDGMNPANDYEYLTWDNTTEDMNVGVRGANTRGPLCSDPLVHGERMDFQIFLSGDFDVFWEQFIPGIPQAVMMGMWNSTLSSRLYLPICTHHTTGWSMRDHLSIPRVGTKSVACHEFMHALGIRGPELLLYTDNPPEYTGNVTDDLMDKANSFDYPDVLSGEHQAQAIQYALMYSEFYPVMDWCEKYDQSGYEWMIVGTKYDFTFKCGYVASYI